MVNRFIVGAGIFSLFVINIIFLLGFISWATTSTSNDKIVLAVILSLLLGFGFFVLVRVLLAFVKGKKI